MELKRPNWKLTRAELEREFAGDNIIRDTKAYKGEYPAYSERDLSSKIAKRGGEILQSDLEFMVTKGDRDRKVECIFDLFPDRKREVDLGESYPLLAKRDEVRFRMWLVHQSKTFPPRQKEVVLLHLEGFSVRQIEQRTGVPKSTVSRYVQGAKLWLEFDRQSDFDRITEHIRERDRVWRETRILARH